MIKLLLILLCLPFIGFGKKTEMLDKIESPKEYINAISKLLPYSLGKVKAYEEIEEREPMDIKITFVDTNGEEM